MFSWWLIMQSRNRKETRYPPTAGHRRVRRRAYAKLQSRIELLFSASLLAFVALLTPCCELRGNRLRDLLDIYAIAFRDPIEPVSSIA
jgi:hypothetical protein